MADNTATVESDMQIPAGRHGAAFAATAHIEPPFAPTPPTDIIGVAQGLGFENWALDPDGVLHLNGYHGPSTEELDEFLALIAPFVTEGSLIRFEHDDGTLYGYRVHDGHLIEQQGTIAWRDTE